MWWLATHLPILFHFMFSDLQEASRIFPCKQMHTTLKKKKKPNVVKIFMRLWLKCPLQYADDSVVMQNESETYGTLRKCFEWRWEQWECEIAKIKTKSWLFIL